VQREVASSRITRVRKDWWYEFIGIVWKFILGYMFFYSSCLITRAWCISLTVYSEAKNSEMLMEVCIE